MSHYNSPLITNSQSHPPTLLSPVYVSPPAASLTLSSVMEAGGQKGGALNDFFLASLEMSVPILSAEETRKEDEEEGKRGLKRISEIGRGKIHTAL